MRLGLKALEVAESRRCRTRCARLMHERGFCRPELEAELASYEAQGGTVTLVADESGALAIYAMADTIDENSKAPSPSSRGRALLLQM